MLLLTSYMDESGHSDDPNFHFTGMAGFVAPEKTWTEVGIVWQKILDIFSLTEPFHMKDFAHSTGQFESWKDDETKRRMLYSNLVKVIVKSGAVPVGAIISLEDFNSLTDEQRSSFKDPYYMAFQTCTRGVALQAMFINPPEKVSMVYSYNQEYGAIESQKRYSVDAAGNAEQLWHVMKASTDYGRWMGSYASGTPESTVQLQVADLFAYELAKEFENLLIRPKDRMRWGLRQILRRESSAFNFIRLFDRKELLRIIKESSWPDQTGVEEITDIQLLSAQQEMAKWFKDRVLFLDDEEQL